MGAYCRLCAAQPDSFVKIYEPEGKEMKLATKITQCLQIWLLPGDPLPKEVCQSCVEQLNASFQFMVTSAKAQVILQAIFAPDIKLPPERNERFEQLNVNEFKTEPDINPEEGALNVGEQLQQREQDPLSDELCNQEVQHLPEPSSEHPGRPEDVLECLLNNTECTKTAPPDQVTSRRKGRTPVRHTGVVSPSDWLDAGSSSEPEAELQKRGKKRRPKLGSKKRKVEDSDLVTDEDGKLKPLLEGYRWHCVTCDNIFDSVHELKAHYGEAHEQSPIFKCMQCLKTYNRYRSFFRHIKLHRSSKTFSCDICGKSFAQKTILQSHSAVHSDERPYSCDQCGKRFKQFSSLYLHNKNHLPIGQREKFPCEHCEKEFATKHTLETHRKLHTGERNFVCDVCGKSFIAKGSLHYHIQTHTGDKPHGCTICGKAFKTPRLLAKHVTLHSGIKPHQCDVCGKQFREKGALREHSRIHTGVMPYACDFCGKKFRFKGILTVHRRQHTGERPYVCLDCPRHFTNWANYNKHMKRRHRNVEGTEHTDPITGRRTFQSHAAAASAAASAGTSITAAGAVDAAAVGSVTAANSLLESDTLNPAISTPSAHDVQQITSKSTDHEHPVEPKKLRLEGEDDEETSVDDEDYDDVDNGNHINGNHTSARHLPEENSNSGNLGILDHFTNYSSHAHSKMAPIGSMLQSHHSGKLTTVFYQDNMPENNLQLHNSYHVPSYVSSLSGLSSGLSHLPSGVPSGLTSGLQPSLQSGLQSGMQSGLQHGVQSGLPPGFPPALSTGLPTSLASNLPSGLPEMSYYMPPVHHSDMHVHPSHSMHRQ